MTWLVEFKAFFLLIWFVGLFGLERIAAAANRPAPSGRVLRNLSLWAVMALSSPLAVLPIAYWAADHGLWVRPSSPSAAFLIGDLIILDLFTYFLHLAYHRAPVMWRFHEPHHLDRFLDSTTALRFHFGEVVLSALARAPLIVVLSIPFSHVLLYELILTAASIFYHSNVKMPPSVENGLSHLVVTPSIHWVHHHRTWVDTNSNYGAVLSIWDRLFGTRSKASRTIDMEIGVPGVDEKPFFGLLLAPFRKSDHT